MLQIVQKLKTGKMQIIEAPLPILQKKNLLIKNYYSLISAGTESSTVKTARKGYIGKAKERPQQVKQVFDTLKSQGVQQTYRAVMKKLDSYSPLGYSCVGEILEVGDDVSNFIVGDIVACGGLTASHSEVVSVPVNLCVKLAPGADLQQAVYNTLGSIALQGVRQADLRLGETCAVIGLGLLGQLTAILLQAAGVKVVGIDINTTMVQIAEKHCLDLALMRNVVGIEEIIKNFTYGYGCDAVIITAASSSLDPINFAGSIARKKGTIVIVGAVPTGFDREPHYYKKELQVKMSCSYGPGRYDPHYEEKGIDYPYPYVRWTENRNMQAFQDLIHSKGIDVSYLTTHTFKLEDAPAAYDMIVEQSQPFIGILIEYDSAKEQKRKKITVKQEECAPKGRVVVGFLGAGSYAQSHLLPNISDKNKVVLKAVMTASSVSSPSVSERFGFEFCTGDEDDIIGNDEINTVFIASRHDSHADLVLKSLKAGKNVFVEKPLCLSEHDLQKIAELLEPNAGRSSRPLLMVGYNRRFSPFAKTIKEKFIAGPMAMAYRINAGYIPNDSWIQDIEYGGGRILGELCHFIDLLTYINGSLPVSVYAIAMKNTESNYDTLNISLNYQNGSIGTISYFANGDKCLPKERVEIFAHGNVAVIDDYKALDIFAQGKREKKKIFNQDKGQRAEISQFVDSIIFGGSEPIPFEEIYNTSLVTLKTIESLRNNERMII
jgi:predicted dehydrogenase/threonine dehydrogenase-like Zn-dependent dehydrogenase